MNNEEIKEIPQIDANILKSLEDFMEAYKMVDVEQVYSNGTEFVPIFRVKQWLEHNNITNLQEENERLKDSLETMTFTAKVKQEAIDSLIKRIDKAIDYIKENADYGIQEKCCMDDLNYDECDILLNILQGGDKE